MRANPFGHVLGSKDFILWGQSQVAHPLLFESQNQSFIQTEQLSDGSNSGITAGVAESKGDSQFV